MYTYDTTSADFMIMRIEWERIFLKMDVSVPAGSDPVFMLRQYDREAVQVSDSEYEAFVQGRRDPHRAEFENGAMNGVVVPELFTYEVLKDAKQEIVERIDDDHDPDREIYRITVNIAAADGRAFMDNGKWQLVAQSGGEEHICSVSYDEAYKLQDVTRVFRYDGCKYAYTITFNTNPSFDGLLSFLIESFFMEQYDKWKKRHYVREALTKIGKIRRMVYFLVIWMIRIYYHVLYAITPKKGNKILFMTETKPYLWGNLLYIHDRLVERGLDKRFELDENCRASVGVHQSIWSWVKTVTQIATHDYIFIDDYAPIFGFFNLGNKTKLIQVWHAGEGFKAVGYCRFGKAGSPYPSESCHKKYDYVITGSQKLVHIFEEVFGIERSAFRPYGMARLDGFLNPEKIESFKKEFYSEHPEFQGKKIILFAPTYRGTGQKSANYPYEQLDLKRIYDFCGDEYIFMFKMHPFIDQEPPIPEEYKDRIVDFSCYQNINDLYYVTDLLITDYSSNFFEYALMKRPVLFFTYDREEYELTRGVHKPVKETAPGKVCDSFDEMMEALEHKDFEVEKIDKFVEDNFGDYDGHAADRIIDNILLGGDKTVTHPDEAKGDK
ncbi:MAG: CDP-glycerol glycerophosphotransferase family protein [Eubacteriales bacterium]|nr:CDP-glycerol glycerophosphotransferase family protein [Eubacteriales bacterium]